MRRKSIFAMPEDRINQILILKDGRRLGFAEFGASAGRPVFHFHGSASSRLEHPAPESTLQQMGIRFITLDRPGHGLSDFQPHRRLVDWPRDVLQLADHLGIGEFYVEGYSSGGPYALACACLLPERAIAGAVFGCVAPMNRPGAYRRLPFFNQALARSARWFPALTMLVRYLMRSMVMGNFETATRQLMSSIPESDKAALYLPQNFEVFTSSVLEGFRTGSQGVAWDDVLVNRKWGFDLASVTPRIDLWHGEADVNVPVHAALYLKEKLPHSRLNLLPGKGHFYVFTCWLNLLSGLVSGT
jgi:pimeloyl-ACP methyl ester carboxylesterase